MRTPRTAPTAAALASELREIAPVLGAISPGLAKCAHRRAEALGSTPDAEDGWNVLADEGDRAAYAVVAYYHPSASGTFRAGT